MMPAKSDPGPGGERQPLMEFRNVVKQYGAGEGAVMALDGANFRIDDGDFVAIMGPSGSGKSTCMNILGCLDTPSGGSYLFKGIDVGGLTRKQRARLRRYYLGFVFQGFNLLARTSALENVQLPLIYRGTKRSERRERGFRALEMVGLAKWWDHTSAELSGGQQQRVAIARAMVCEPAVLLADEPTGNLDSARSREIMELLCTLNRERGLSIAMVTHDRDMASYAKRTISFRDGVVHTDMANSPAADAGAGKKDQAARSDS
jgi:putative ABC transport system ATP-binding protein